MTLYQKITEKGLDYVSDSELLTLVAGDCAKSFSIKDVAKMDFYDLKSYGLTTQQACKIIAVMEIGRRKLKYSHDNKLKIRSSRNAYEILQPSLSDLQHEEFWVLYLNRSNQLITSKKISQGGISGTVVDSRLIVREAINLLASGVVLSHNHPSGNLEPSDADKKITEKIKRGLGMLDIALIDHIIVGDNKYFSFADEGIL